MYQYQCLSVKYFGKKKQDKIAKKHNSKKYANTMTGKCLMHHWAAVEYILFLQFTNGRFLGDIKHMPVLEETF